MTLLLITQMRRRIKIARDTSDTDYFMAILYFGEMLTKLTAAGLLAAIDDNSRGTRYRLLHRLVRADGIGEWAKVIDDLLGPDSQCLCPGVQSLRRELTQRLPPGHWQTESLTTLANCIKVLIPDRELGSRRADAREWFSSFSMLRNKTRGHGAPPTSSLSAACVDLEKSIELLSSNLTLFTMPWAYIYQQLSGKYVVIGLTESTVEFDYLPNWTGPTISQGVYVDMDGPRKVDLVESTT
ncbi:MAG: hypothetical protein ACR2PL_02725, partial [Dehalococcoidia bacterium]